MTPVPIKGNGIISKFYSIKRIYLGARMEKEEKKKLYEICNEKNIEVRCMVIDPRQYKI